MTALTRRRSDNDHQETRHIYRDDVHIGTIGKRAGVPMHVDQWGWPLGFYPSTEPGTQKLGTASRERGMRSRTHGSVDLTEDNFECWRRSRDFHAWKYRMWDVGCRMPTQNCGGWRPASAASGFRLPARRTFTALTRHRGMKHVEARPYADPEAAARELTVAGSVKA